MSSLDSLVHTLYEKKKQLDSYRPLPPELVKNLDEWFKIELTYTSNAIEGNTLSRSETALVVEKGITVGGKSMREHLEAINLAYAIDYVRTLVQKERSEITLEDIKQIHAIILRDIEPEQAGAWRKVAVRIAGSDTQFPDAVKVPELMDEFINWLQTNAQEAVYCDAQAHLKLVAIHPFIDGNGRTARLLMNLLLMQEGFPPALIRPEDRLAYIQAIEKAVASGDKDNYYTIIFEAIERSLDIYLNAIAQSDLRAQK